MSPVRPRSVALVAVLAAGLATAGLSASSGSPWAGGDGAVEVTVLDSAARPVAGAAVSLDASEEDPYRHGTTGSSGVAVFRGVEQRTLELTVGAPGRLTSDVRLVEVPASGAVRLRVVLLRPGRVTGRVTAVDGSSPTRLGADLTEASDPDLPAGDTSSVARDGRFTVTEVPPGRYQVTTWDGTGRYLMQCPGGDVVDYGGFSCPPAQDVTVTEGGTTTVPDQVLRHRAAAFSGTVTDAHGHPVRGASTYPYLVGAGETFGNGVRHPHDDTLSGRDGHYRVLGLPPGTYTLLVGSNESNDWASTAYGGGRSFATGARFRLTAGRTTRGIDVVLQRLVYLRSAPVVRGSRVTVPVRVRWWGGNHPAYGDVTVSLDLLDRLLARRDASAARGPGAGRAGRRARGPAPGRRPLRRHRLRPRRHRAPDRHGALTGSALGAAAGVPDVDRATAVDDDPAGHQRPVVSGRGRRWAGS